MPTCYIKGKLNQWGFTHHRQLCEKNMGKQRIALIHGHCFSFWQNSCDLKSYVTGRNSVAEAFLPGNVEFLLLNSCYLNLFMPFISHRSPKIGPKTFTLAIVDLWEINSNRTSLILLHQTNCLIILVCILPKATDRYPWDGQKKCMMGNSILCCISSFWVLCLCKTYLDKSFL